MKLVKAEKQKSSKNGTEKNLKSGGKKTTIKNRAYAEKPTE
jgi:hypothetical protein